MGRAHRQHAGVGAFPWIADAAVPRVVLDRTNTPNRYLKPVGCAAAVVGHHYGIPAISGNLIAQLFRWNLARSSSLKVEAVRDDVCGGKVPKKQVEIATSSTPAIVPPQLDCYPVARIKEHLVEDIGPVEVEKPISSDSTVE